MSAIPAILAMQMANMRYEEVKRNQERLRKLEEESLLVDNKPKYTPEIVDSEISDTWARYMAKQRYGAIYGYTN